ncbi:thioredoxin family protein [Streptomyces maremycinicus]|uniref:thioredoxin family protein n=1 Tax=Streptomyces maremycinicus TaxID=1679753 RepID=UPI0007872097|nr:thioredoxin family protein [Streptomyces sp. NBRC 110468]
MGVTTSTTGAHFALQVLTATTPVLVCFRAAWDPQSQHQRDVLRQIAQTLTHRVQIVCIDVDREPELAVHYQVWLLPTLVLLCGGRQVHRIDGAAPAPLILRELTALL